MLAGVYHSQKLHTIRGEFTSLANNQSNLLLKLVVEFGFNHIHPLCGWLDLTL